MRFFETVFASAALVSAVLAQLAINDFPTGGVVAGQTYTITYSPKDQTPTEIILRQGPSGNLNTVSTIGTATGGTFSWTVPASLPNQPNYALEVRRGNQNNFSGQFGLTGGSAAGTSASASASAPSASTPSASASSPRASASSASPSVSRPTSPAVSSPSPSASPSISGGSNSTISSATLSTKASATGSRTASASSPPVNTGAASVLDSSPVALVFGAVAAFFYLA